MCEVQRLLGDDGFWEKLSKFFFKKTAGFDFECLFFICFGREREGHWLRIFLICPDEDAIFFFMTSPAESESGIHDKAYGTIWRTCWSGGAMVQTSSRLFIQ